jgi:hypothetical protein
MGSSSFALKLHTPETAHSERTETEGNSGRQYLSIFTCSENPIIVSEKKTDTVDDT